uniref:XRN 5'-3' exonuclease N-terminus n=1 Tax=Mimiviridae sp. ChoanoV1 TaxID=2596887 RepID=A0A5B8IPR0_9VIRU|nr:XRN 5'-3' exonuclease N-terminus [Mimiviridae sp. ChoanoV1]
MGIPLFFRYLVNNYDDLLTSNKQLLDCDNLYLDLNCAIHYCCREVLKNEKFSLTKQNDIENKMIQFVIQYIEILVQYSKPKKLLYIAIDGPAPKAKLNQQRMRRFKKFYDKKTSDELKIKFKEEINEESEWDTNAITPGTLFMDKLSKKLKSYFINRKIIKVIISDSNIPGEGEHKLLNHLKNNYVSDETNIIYGLDADLIMLCLIANKPNIYLLRETVEFNNKIHVEGYKFLYLNIDNLKKNLLIEIESRLGNILLNEEKKNKIVYDYIFLSFILGNDFIPHSPSVGIKNNGIDLLLDLYVRYYFDTKSNLVLLDEKKINHDFLKFIIRDLGMMEDSLLETFTKKRNKRRTPNKTYENQYEREKDLLNMFPQFNRDIEIKIDQGSEGWRDRYYKNLFDIQNRYEIDKVCHKYLEGLFWNFQYYNFGCISWEWSYYYNYPPSFNDIYNYMDKYISDINLIQIPKSKPFRPFEQLLMVLPQQSKDLLPPKLGNQMIDISSDIIQYYPIEYDIETTNNYYLWECHPKLPYVISEDIKEIVRNTKLSEEEKLRNKVGKEWNN